jgi:hypothetical protein
MSVETIQTTRPTRAEAVAEADRLNAIHEWQRRGVRFGVIETRAWTGPIRTVDPYLVIRHSADTS